MNAKNCAELLSKENVDGGLIGGASLKAADFNTNRRISRGKISFVTRTNK